MTKKFPIHPKHPERVCWGCDRYCSSDALACGNGSVATPHPSELFGEDWMSWGLDAREADPVDEPVRSHMPKYARTEGAIDGPDEPDTQPPIG